MADRRQSLQQLVTHAAHRLFAPPPAAAGLDADEFDESDVWGCPVEHRQAESSKPVPSATRRKAGNHEGEHRAAASSMALNIPDWSKILGSQSSSGGRGSWEEEAGGEEGGGAAAGPLIPPHELLWQNRGTSFSVHEGAGRTLKGRDLRRFRNAIWEKTGFQD